ncbi:MAG: class I SAM-dependent methyltransferase [Methylophilaceae bacterium]
MKNARIKEKNIAIDPHSVASFFHDRAEKFNPQHPLTAVLYQDNNPALAEERDAYEKQVALPLLKLTGKESLLDIGCGIGRWAHLLHHKVKYYMGIDFSQGLIAIAKQQIRASNVAFFTASAEELGCAEVKLHAPFDRILIAGLLIYLNDDQIMALLNDIRKIVAKDCLIYLREPIALEERLTLNQFWSEELSANYSAIYRTENDLKTLINQTLGDLILTPIKFVPLYKDNALNNRNETKQFYAMLHLGNTD